MWEELAAKLDIVINSLSANHAHLETLYAHNSTQLNVNSPIKQTRDTAVIHQMHGRLPERPKPIYAGHP